jgi:hypothetical protein
MDKIAIPYTRCHENSALLDMTGSEICELALLKLIY